MNTQEPASTVASSSTATPAPADPPSTVTSSSPTPSSSAFQPYQQLHEAMLAAVNSHGVTSLSHEGLLAAAAAAAAHAHAHHTNTQNDHQQGPVDYAKKDSIRVANRERKKKWRLHNEERNKDNDLRCRVNKRANKLFGPLEHDAKTLWVNEEFEKRRQKRMEKERRKNIVDNVLSVPGQSMPIGLPGSTPPTTFYPPVSIDPDSAAKILGFPSDLQRQLLEQLNNSMMALTNAKLPTPPVEYPSESLQPDTDIKPDLATTEQALSSLAAELSSNTIMPTEKKEETEKEGSSEKKAEYPMDAVLTLMQLNAGWRQ
ncbi:hypothetical protein J3Q64DRAFT_1716309 [Phycomyces blakesleeanus]|uniref:DUF3020 domain-containing protein n=2 Tax=Phycomyces blakesleeanus TaxID=4837 RepID=A0A162YCX8_PHYB8|nr:hypothetical protein PHYBLDRAFT_184957 [Phycomyces blakesleeanus NRRL 1555(-)]OAD79865.1 hypothetical protein PHYBLDRAFT_184957 [Phycomyces blakesleeanus NRRL 1555(-)]|eukprot:XP_018297905.1 hypothetical protein PHYBLDRAFT_184957 [Phycomyces blakesleeanus NRRL 1555(-)]